MTLNFLYQDPIDHPHVVIKSRQEGAIWRNRLAMIIDQSGDFWVNRNAFAIVRTGKNGERRCNVPAGVTRVRVIGIDPSKTHNIRAHEYVPVVMP